MSAREKLFEAIVSATTRGRCDEAVMIGLVDAVVTEALLAAGVQYVDCQECGAARPVNGECGNCTFKAWVAAEQAARGTVAAPAPVADFFQPGHTYANDRGFRFECHAVAPTPWDGTPSAIGYLTHPDGSEHVHGMTAEQWADGDWDDTTDTTTGGSHV